ncbi:MAG TPA: hypothetical protein VKA08_03045 [Balneolales bacterium]|nr:hypothetical protein [Balneolales bacterium]
MNTKLTLKPGQRGTKKLLKKYGNRLVCVRYRYDEEKKLRYKTVELIVDVTEWEPKEEIANNGTIHPEIEEFKIPEKKQSIDKN